MRREKVGPPLPYKRSDAFAPCEDVPEIGESRVNLKDYSPDRDHLSVVIQDLRDALEKARGEYDAARKWAFEAERRVDVAGLHVNAIGAALDAIDGHTEKFKFTSDGE